MIFLLDTSTPVCKLTVVANGQYYDSEWQADRQLAKGLLAYIHDQLERHDATINDLKGIGAFTGPGSFTGLRIALTVANTLAESLGIPIVGTNGDDWQKAAISRLEAGENDRIVLPFYGSGAHITAPRK